jgi:siroheme synthase
MGPHPRLHQFVLGSVQDFATVMTHQSHAEVLPGIKANSFVTYMAWLELPMMKTSKQLD